MRGKQNKSRRNTGGGSIRKIKGGAVSVGALAPALQMAAGATAVTSFSYVTYLFLFVILGLIIWILYLIQDNLRGGGVAAKNVLPSNSFTYEKTEHGITTGDLVTAYPLASPGTKHDPFEDPYEPPLKNDGMYFPKDSSDVRGVPLLNQPILASTCNSGLCNAPPPTTVASILPGWPINMKTRGFSPEFSQLGILTYDRGGNGENSLNDNMILPLFGRRVMNGRDKYQYYTMSNTGAVNTKLPVTIRGKNCIGEYGCDEISDGDIVQVQGYNRTFYATIYENSIFSYIPFL